MLISDSIFVTFLTTTRKVERWVDVGANFPKKEYLKCEKKRWKEERMRQIEKMEAVKLTTINESQI